MPKVAQKLPNIIWTCLGGGGGGEGVDATQDLNPLLPTNNCVYSVPTINLPGNNLVLLDFGS